MRRRLRLLVVLAVVGGIACWWWQRRQGAPNPSSATATATATDPAAPEPTLTPAPGPAPFVAVEPAVRWVAPVDGECPSGFTVKANDNSGIYHVPGGRFYARTVPERCYATADDAEADGYRRAKA